MDITVITAQIPTPIAARMDESAERMSRTQGSIVTEALARWLDEQDERYQRTLEGLADVDAGRVIDHEKVIAWAESLGTKDPLPVPTC